MLGNKNCSGLEGQLFQCEYDVSENTADEGQYPCELIKTMPELSAKDLRHSLLHYQSSASDLTFFPCSFQHSSECDSFMCLR